MNATPLPLPLELAKPMLLAGDLDTQLRTTFGHAAYDPTTQVRLDGYCCTDSDTSSDVESSNESESSNGVIVIDVQFDFQLDFAVLDDIIADIVL